MRDKTAGARPRPEKKGIHPRSRFSVRYDFERLTACCPELVEHVYENEFGDVTIDFSDPEAVKRLNRALLAHHYGIGFWDVPEGYLCPPIPGRADHLHAIADLLGSSNGGAIPRGGSVSILDIGVGASCIYPIVGQSEYGWSFLGSEADPVAFDSASRIVARNPKLARAVELRPQANPGWIYRGILDSDEVFDVSICNPPFHSSPEEAQAGSLRKWRSLSEAAVSDRKPRKPKRGDAPLLNFGGRGSELWCPGGEAGFVKRMIEESALEPTNFHWVTSLVSKETSLPLIYRALDEADVSEVRTLAIAHGQKKSRIVAWTFLSPRERDEWRRERWLR